MIMKRHLAILIAVSALIVSCSMEEAMPGRYYDSDMASEPSAESLGAFNAIATIKKTPTDSVYFQLNDSTTVYPTNYQDAYTRMERVIGRVHVFDRHTGRFNYTCWVEWAEPLEEGTVSSSAKGDDPIDVLDDWMTSVEDGFLTVHYDAMWGRSATIHSFSIVTGTNSGNPYELVLKHNANGDGAEQKGDGLVFFDINSLPDTGGQYKQLTLKWNDLEGKACERQFKFKTRE